MAQETISTGVKIPPKKQKEKKSVRETTARVQAAEIVSIMMTEARAGHNDQNAQWCLVGTTWTGSLTNNNAKSNKVCFEIHESTCPTPKPDG